MARIIPDVDTATIKTEGFEELGKKLKVRIPAIARKMGFSLDAKLAVIGRRKEQIEANTLEMGRPQWKGKHPYAVYSMWHPRRGWVSTTREASAKKGGGPFMLSNISFRGAQKFKDAVVGHYTSQLANLWSHQTKPYTATSPVVGQSGRLKTWNVGDTRPAKYSWSMVASILSRMEEQAIRRTEAEYADQLEKEF